MKEKTWKDKAHRIIAALCMAEYRKANIKKDGTKYKKHRQYTIPIEAELLVECLDKNNELEAKRLFLYNYEIEQVIKSGIV